MRKTTIPIPLIGLFAGTRAMLGAGVGLLLADRLAARKRRNLGWKLFAVGAASTVPLAFRIFRNR